MDMNGPQILFVIPIFGGIPITQTVVTQWVAIAILAIGCRLLTRKLSVRPGKMQVLLEKGVLMMVNMVRDTMGAHCVGYTPFITTVFLSSLLGTLLGTLGFLRSSTADLSTTLAWALAVTAIIYFNNIRHNGVIGWLKGFAEPVAVMLPINLVSEVAQPVSMSFRHFGNIAGGGVMMTLIYTTLASVSSALLNLLLGWIPGKLGAFLTGIPIFQVGIPAVLSIYFDFFSAFVQALVFTMLTMVYISASVPEPEGK